LQELTQNRDVKDIVERSLQVAIEVCLDIGKIIISDQKLREPQDNKDVFRVLAENNIISEEKLTFLIQMAGARNILVHGYNKIDSEIVLGVLRRHLNDFYEYIGEIQKNYLTEDEKEGKDE
jgi:uncharacterized protein YutE (UPF0331/DUF86 family)